MKIAVRKIGSRWQPVDSAGNVVRGDVYNADGTGYSSKEGAAEAAEMLRMSRTWNPSVPGSHATRAARHQGLAEYEEGAKGDEDAVDILSIDAWSDGEGGWTWNQWFKVGKISRSQLAALKTNAQLMKYMRDEGYLKDASKGRVTIDDDQHNYVIVDKRSREPLFAIAYGEGQ